MPIYEYRCAACGHHLEALQKMSDGPLRKCPDCGKSQLRRLVSASRFRLKGSGWYETDFKGDAETKRNLLEKAGADASDGGEKSGDGKDAASKEPAAPAPAEAGDKTKSAPNDAKPKRSAKPAAAARGKKPAAKPSTASSSRR